MGRSILLAQPVAKTQNVEKNISLHTQALMRIKDFFT